MTSIREDGLLGIILVSNNQCVPSAQEKKKKRFLDNVYRTT